MGWDLPRGPSRLESVLLKGRVAALAVTVLCVCGWTGENVNWEASNQSRALHGCTRSRFALLTLGALAEGRVTNPCSTHTTMPLPVHLSVQGMGCGMVWVWSGVQMFAPPFHTTHEMRRGNHKI